MKAMVEYIIKTLVDYPEQVKVQESVGAQTVVFELYLAKSDIGKVVGKQGQTIQALRTIINGAGMKLGKRAMVEIIED